jgi:C4-dicarboxylate-specific signal transduction histidine kinase
LFVLYHQFVDKGFIRLVAFPTEDKVSIRVEDSGPGVPKEKHGQLFFKFQESLDLMSQVRLVACAQY